MDIYEWRADQREIPEAERSAFYDAPLDELTIFRYRTQRFALDPHRTHFSLKFTLSGRESYVFGRRTVELHPGAFLFTNDHEVHGSAVTDPTEALSIFVPYTDASALGRAAVSSVERLLEAPHDLDAAPLIAQTPIACGPAVTARLQRVLCALDQSRLHALEGAAIGLVHDAMVQAYDAAPPSALRDIRRRSTRDELIARVLRAKALIDDSDGRGYDLDGLARAACLSKHHLARVFAEVVGVSPGGYARRLRLEAARRELALGQSLERVARGAGYQSLRRFRDAYARAFGEDLHPRGSGARGADH